MAGQDSSVALSSATVNGPTSGHVAAVGDRGSCSRGRRRVSSKVVSGEVFSIVRAGAWSAIAVASSVGGAEVAAGRGAGRAGVVGDRARVEVGLGHRVESQRRSCVSPGAQGASDRQTGPASVLSSLTTRAVEGDVAGVGDGVAVGDRLAPTVVYGVVVMVLSIVRAGVWVASAVACRSAGRGCRRSGCRSRWRGW